MGALVSCCKSICGEKEGDNYETIQGNSGKDANPTPNPEERRRQLAEAAEKRRAEAEHRGVKDVDAVRRAQQKALQREQLEEEMTRKGNSGDGNPLTWTVS